MQLSSILMDDRVEADLATTTDWGVEEPVYDVHGNSLTRIGKTGIKMYKEVDSGLKD